MLCQRRLGTVFGKEKSYFSLHALPASRSSPVVMQTTRAVLHPGRPFLQPVRLNNRGGASPECLTIWAGGAQSCLLNVLEDKGKDAKNI